MVDGQQRLAGGERQRLGGGETDHEAADQARSGRGGYCVDFGEAEAGLAEGCCYHAVEGLDVSAGGDFGHDAAENGVVLDLRQDHVRTDLALAVGAALDHGGRGLVTAGLDPEDDHRRLASPAAGRYSAAALTPRMMALQSAGTRALRIGTRGSPLALAQATEARRGLARAGGAA